MPRANSIIYASIVVIVTTLLATPAGATPWVDNRTGWLALTSGVLTITFEDLAPTSSPYFVDYGSAAGITLGDVKFVGVAGDPPYNLKVWDPAGGTGNWGSGDYMVGGWSPGYILATFPAAGASAVGVDLMTYGSVHDVTVTLSNGGSYSVPTSAAPTRTFFGFVFGTPITSIAFSGNGTFAEIDNFSYSLAGEIPEPDTIFLGAIGLAGLWLARRLRRPN